MLMFRTKATASDYPPQQGKHFSLAKTCSQEVYSFITQFVNRDEAKMNGRINAEGSFPKPEILRISFRYVSEIVKITAIIRGRVIGVGINLIECFINLFAPFIKTSSDIFLFVLRVTISITAQKGKSATTLSIFELDHQHVALRRSLVLRPATKPGCVAGTENSTTLVLSNSDASYGLNQVV